MMLIEVEAQESCIEGCMPRGLDAVGRESQRHAYLHTPPQRAAATLRDGAMTSEAREMARKKRQTRGKAGESTCGFVRPIA